MFLTNRMYSTLISGNSVFIKISHCFQIKYIFVVDSCRIIDILICINNVVCYMYLIDADNILLNIFIDAMVFIIPDDRDAELDHLVTAQAEFMKEIMTLAFQNMLHGMKEKSIINKGDFNNNSLEIEA